MRSKWFELKDKAIHLRKRGASIRRIEAQLGIPRATLSGWFRTVLLTEKQKLLLHSKWEQGLVKARIKAVQWHNTQKETRLKTAELQARTTLESADSLNNDLIEIAFAMLYLGEGFKTNSQTGMGNSDPLILQFFVTILRNIYKVDMAKIKCELHLRADQEPAKMREYWSEQLNIPLQNFTSISIDKRTQGSSTYPSYKGVCVVRCGHAAIQRKSMYLGRLYTKRVINNYKGA